MPQPFSDAVITAAGAALLLRVETGEAALEVTKIVVGDPLRASGILTRLPTFPSFRKTALRSRR